MRRTLCLLKAAWPAATLSLCAAQIYPADFVQLLSAGRQREQVWETGTPHPLSLDFRDRPSPERLLQVLYPGREHPSVYTPVEQLYLAQTTFRWLFDNFLLNVPLSLPPQSLANFFIYVTLPVAVFNVKLQSLLSGQALNFTGQDAFWGDSSLNFSFTPRSA